MKNKVKIDPTFFLEERERIKRVKNCSSDEKLRALADISTTPYYVAVELWEMTLKTKKKLEDAWLITKRFII